MDIKVVDNLVHRKLCSHSYKWSLEQVGDFDRRCALHTDLLRLGVDSSTKDAGMRLM